MDSVIVRCWDPMQAHKAITRQVWPALKAALMAGKRMVVKVEQEKRSLAQNARLWAMLTDISRQVDWYGQKLSPADWKHIFTAALKKTRAVPGIDGGIVVLGQSTSSMTKAEMAELQELIEAFGADKGVKFRAPVDPETWEINP